MTIIATRETYDTAIAALEQADRENRPNYGRLPFGPDGEVCACVVVAEAFEPDVKKVRNNPYAVLHTVGLRTKTLYTANDDDGNRGPRRVEGGFRRAADALIAEAERLCGEAAAVNELVSA